MYRGAGLLIGERTTTVIVGHQFIFTLIIVITLNTVAKLRDQSISFGDFFILFKKKLPILSNQLASL